MTADRHLHPVTDQPPPPNDSSPNAWRVTDRDRARARHELKACQRCGIVRRVNRSRGASLCRDCIDVTRPTA